LTEGGQIFTPKVKCKMQITSSPHKEQPIILHTIHSKPNHNPIS